MKAIFLTLAFITFFLQQINAFAANALQAAHSAEDGQKEALNISSWSIEDAAMQTKITSVLPSPDGKYVLVESYPPYVDDSKIQPSEISLIHKETKKIVWKTSIDWLCLNPQWAPDGKNISFLRAEVGGKYTLYLTPFNKYEPIEIAQGSWNPSGYYWSPDGKTIALLISKEGPSIEDKEYVIIGPSTHKALCDTRSHQRVVLNSQNENHLYHQVMLGV